MSRRGRGNRGQGRGRGFRRGFNAQSNNQPQQPQQQKKTLADHIYFVGSSKAANNYIKTTDFIINHIKKTYTHGDDIGKALEELQEIDWDSLMPVLKQPKAGLERAEAEAMRESYKTLHSAQVNSYVKRCDMYTANKGKAYALIWGQCTKTLQDKIKSNQDYSQIHGDPIPILKLIVGFSVVKLIILGWLINCEQMTA
jgi:hypothetical protein